MMTMEKAGARVRYRVTRTIGHRGLQEYVGDRGRPNTDEVRLPFGWWPRIWRVGAADRIRSVARRARCLRAGARAVGGALSVVSLDVSVRSADRARVGTLGVGHGLEQLVATANGVADAIGSRSTRR